MNQLFQIGDIRAFRSSSTSEYNVKIGISKSGKLLDKHDRLIICRSTKNYNYFLLNRPKSFWNALINFVARGICFYTYLTGRLA